MPPTWPMIQLFGSGFGQDASTAKVGTSPARAAHGQRRDADQRGGGDGRRRWFW